MVCRFIARVFWFVVSLPVPVSRQLIIYMYPSSKKIYRVLKKYILNRKFITQTVNDFGAAYGYKICMWLIFLLHLPILQLHQKAHYLWYLSLYCVIKLPENIYEENLSTYDFIWLQKVVTVRVYAANYKLSCDILCLFHSS